MNWAEDDQRYGRAAKERHFGKYAGTVVDNGPPDTGSHRGEVQVSVAGILEEKPDGSGNRPLQVTASPAFAPGVFFVPENDDLLWVEFVNGDINFPVWSGAWYAEDATPKTIDDSAPTQDQKIIRTKSGLVVQLDDTSGSEQIVVKDGVNNNLFTFDSSGVTIEAKGSSAAITLKVGKSSLVVADDGMTLTSGISVIKLGGGSITATDTTGAAQALMLKPFEDWFNQTFSAWALKHMHPTAGLGPPSPPAPPLPIPAAPNPAQSLSGS